MSEPQPCDNFKVDMTDNAMGPEQRCKNCKCAKKLHTMSNSAPAAKSIGGVASRIAQLQSKFSGPPQQNQQYVQFTKKPSVECNKQSVVKKTNSIETKEESPNKQVQETIKTTQQSQQEKIVQNINTTTTPQKDIKSSEINKETNNEPKPSIIESPPQKVPQQVEEKQDNSPIQQEQIKKEKVDIEYDQPPKRFSLQYDIYKDPQLETTSNQQKKTSQSPKQTVNQKNVLDIPEIQTRTKSQTFGSKMMAFKLPINFGPPPVKKEKSIFDEAQCGKAVDQLLERPIIKRNQKRDIDNTFMDDD